MNKESILKLSGKMIEIPFNHYDKVWVLCGCPECDSNFIVELKQTDNTNPDNIFGLNPPPEKLTCPYCGTKNVSYAEHFPKVEL